MACRGVFFALTKEEEAKLLAAPSSDAVVEIITEEIEERWDRNWLVEMDKSWDAVHRCMGDGSLRTSQPSRTAKAVLGGRQLSSRADWIISYLTADEVKQVADAIARIDEPEFRSASRRNSCGLTGQITTGRLVRKTSNTHGPISKKCAFFSR